MSGQVSSGDCQDGFGDVDELGEAVAGGTGGVAFGGEVLPLFGEMNDEGDAGAGVVEVAFGADGDAAVVGAVNDDGVFSLAHFFESLEELADAAIRGFEFVVEGLPVGTGFCVVDLVGGDRRDVFGFGGEFFETFFREEARFVRLREVDFQEEGLAFVAS